MKVRATSGRVFGVFLLLVIGVARPVSAQSNTSANVRLPRLFVGAGAGVSATDPTSRMRLGSEMSPFVWLIEGGVAVSSNFGIGGEYVRVGDVTGTTSGHGWTSSGMQQERQFIGIVRGRVMAFGPIALDLVGGIGVLKQRHEDLHSVCYAGTCTNSADVFEQNAPAYAFGGDVTLASDRRVSLVVMARVYILGRGTQEATISNNIPWQYEFTSSSRATLAVTARVH